MKKLFFFCATVLLYGTIQAQVLNCANQNTIPSWVEKVTTKEEYAIWKTLSRYYRVDYSYVKYQRQESKVAKMEVYDRLKKLCDRLESGELKVGPNETFAVVSTDRGTLSPFNEHSIVCREKHFLLYTDVEGYDAHLMLKLVYVYDEVNRTVDLLKKEIYAKSFSGISVSVDDVAMNLSLDYLSEDGQFKGYCYAVMKVVTPEGEMHLDQVNVNFRINL